MSNRIDRLSQQIATGEKEDWKDKVPFSSTAYGAVVMGAAAVTLGVNTLGGSVAPPEQADYEALVGVDQLNVEMFMPAGWQVPESPYASGDYKGEAAHENTLMTLVTEDGLQILEVAQGDTANMLSLSDYEVCTVEGVNEERVGGYEMERSDLACLGDYAVTLWTGAIDNESVTVRHGREPGFSEADAVSMSESLAVGQ